MTREDFDLTGKRFGRWTVLRRSDGDALYWECVCDCGTASSVYGSNLRGGKTRSCGCYRNQRTSEVCKTHGMSKSSEYKIWVGIKIRCTDSTRRSFRNYGGRGISMCQRWSDSFEAFYEDMGPRPSPRHSIDRIDNNGNYEPGNCRWASISEQATNRRNTNLLTFNGVTASTKEWARRLGMNYQTLVNRIQRRGWTIEKALTEPVKGTK